MLVVGVQIFDVLIILEPTDYAGRKVSLLISGVLVVMGSSLLSASFTSWLVHIHW